VALEVKVSVTVEPKVVNSVVDMEVGSRAASVVVVDVALARVSCVGIEDPPMTRVVEEVVSWTNFIVDVIEPKKLDVEKVVKVDEIIGTLVSVVVANEITVLKTLKRVEVVAVLVVVVRTESVSVSVAVSNDV
jgi:hypothetical protein